MLDHVLEYIDPQTQVISMAPVSKELSQGVNDPKRWRDQLVSDFGISVESRVLRSPLQREKSIEPSFWKKVYLDEREADLIEAAGVYDGLC